VTLAIGGMLNNKKSLVTKTSYRFIHTLDNLKPSPEPNITVLWSENLPLNYKLYSAKMSIKTSSLQYQNDDLMCKMFGTDYGVSCCVSGMTIGKNMQYFGARCNIAKALLYAINEGKDEITNQVVIEGIPPLKNDPLDYDEVLNNYFLVIEKMAKIYEKAMHIIHFMHDKYAYEASLMALHDEEVHRFMAYGIAGLSVAADSLSAIKFAKVKPLRNNNNVAYDFLVEGDFPTFGNDDDLVDDLAILITEKVSSELKKRKLYRNAEATLSILTITSNVVYGEKTGSTPDGRKKGEAFAPGASPMHNRDTLGAVASLNSVSKLDYINACKDGISNTFSITPDSLGDKLDQASNLVSLLNGYFKKGAHHLNVNVLNRKMLIEAMKDPLKYPLLTIRVSGYAVRFNRLTKQQQLEVINRTFHDKI
jgi:formate C-acetyltransferase